MAENYKQLNHSAEELDEAILSEKTHVNDSVSHITATERKNWNNAFDTSKNLQNQVDNLVANSTPTEGNAELIDIRVGGDGATYTTAGEAVRTQFNRTPYVYCNIINPLEITEGYYKYYDSVDVSLRHPECDNLAFVTGATSGFIPCRVGDRFFSLGKTNVNPMTLYYYLYNSSQSLIAFVTSEGYVFKVNTNKTVSKINNLELKPYIEIPNVEDVAYVKIATLNSSKFAYSRCKNFEIIGVITEYNKPFIKCDVFDSEVGFITEKIKYISENVKNLPGIENYVERFKENGVEIIQNVLNPIDSDVIEGGYYQYSDDTSYTPHPQCSSIIFRVNANYSQSGYIPTKPGDKLGKTTATKNSNPWLLPVLYFDENKNLIYYRHSDGRIFKVENGAMNEVEKTEPGLYIETPNYSNIAYLSLPFSNGVSYSFGGENVLIGMSLPYGVPYLTTGNLSTIDKSQWKGKTWYAYGTSLTSIAQGKYVPKVASELGMSVVNKGIPGGGVVSNTQIYDALMDLTDGKMDADLITIEVGANDGSAPLGEPTSLDTTTLCGAINTCIKNVLMNTNAQVVLMCSTSSRHGLNDSENPYEIDHETNGGYTYLERNKAIEDCAKANNVYFVPLAEGMGIYRTRNANAEYLVDNIHMTDVGGLNTAKSLIHALKNIPTWETSL